MASSGTKVTALTSTWLKDTLKNSTDPSNDGKVVVSKGNTITIATLGPSVSGHRLVTFVPDYLGKKQAYVFEDHFAFPMATAKVHIYKPPSASQPDRDLGNLQPKFKSMVDRVLTKCAAEGIDIYVNEGLRSFARQAYLYAQGRTRAGAIVTHARAGQSNHHWGLAVDCYPRLNGKVNFNFDRSKEGMRQMNRFYDLCEANGIACGARGATGSFIDLPHVQIAGINLKTMIGRYPNGYIPGVSKAI